MIGPNYCGNVRRGKILEQQGKANVFEVSQDQIIGKGTYFDPQHQVLYDEQILFLCHKEALNARDKIQELEKLTESQKRVKQCQREPFNVFVQRLTKIGQIRVTDQLIDEYLLNLWLLKMPT